VASALRGKIQAMKDVHELIARAGGQSIGMEDMLHRLIHAIADANVRQRIITHGDHTVTVPAQQAGALAMILQELLTNSAKHGVLRDQTDGTLKVRWSRDDAGRSVITWEERHSTVTNGPVALVALAAGAPKSPRAGTGLGLLLIEGFARSDLRGWADFSSGPGWWKCVLYMNTAEDQSMPPLKAASP
jgi:two-component system, sensor histidine kinase PdtaS